jgi:hypothetical protein
MTTWFDVILKAKGYEMLSTGWTVTLVVVAVSVLWVYVTRQDNPSSGLVWRIIRDVFWCAWITVKVIWYTSKFAWKYLLIPGLTLLAGLTSAGDKYRQAPQAIPGPTPGTTPAPMAQRVT